MSRKARAVVSRLNAAELPVLRRTVAGLASLQEAQDSVSAAQLAGGVLHDPLMTLKVLRYVNGTHHMHVESGVGSIGHALMMLGISRFFRAFSTLRSAEECLRGNIPALSHLLRLTNQAWHASCQARDWATCRKDSRIEEVRIATLLHDVGEMVLLLHNPRPILDLEAAAPVAWRGQPDLQNSLLGFTLQEFQAVLATSWELPELLQHLLQPEHGDNPRVQTVSLAHRVARRVLEGCSQEALQPEAEEVAGLLHFSVDEVTASIQHVASAARAPQWAGTAAERR